MITYDDIKSGVVAVPASDGGTVSLVRYDAACRALAEAKSVDDVRDVRDRSEAMRAYAKQAKNKQLEVDAAEIRIRAERRLGEMIAAQRETVGLSEGGRPAKTGSRADPVSLPTLAEAGIDKHLADRARKLAAIPETEFTEIVSDWRGRVERENERVSINLLKSGERHAAAAQDVDTRTDVEREADAMVLAWDKGRPESREMFFGYLRGIGFTIVESNQATGMGGGNVDRSVTRASSAVEVGATNSPDGADSICVGSAARGQAASSGECPEAPSRSAEKMVISATAAADRDAGSTPTCALKPRDDITVGTNSQSAVPTVEAVADDPQAPREPATAEIHPDPHSPRLTTGSLHPSSDAQPAQNGSGPHAVGQDRGTRVLISGQSEHQSAGNPQDRNEPVSGAPASVATFNNPQCQKPDTCRWAHSQASCSACASAAMKARAA